MDTTLRGIIEREIDEMLKGKIKYVDWGYDEIPLSNIKDFLRGYLIGAIQGLCRNESIALKRRTHKWAKKDD